LATGQTRIAVSLTALIGANNKEQKAINSAMAIDATSALDI
jgi:hypothetical protein